jgi:[protein-PII] uridylyltransferase
LKRLPFDTHEIDAIAQLILHHLTMYHAATRRDVDDPATVDEFAAVVGDRECLRNLYLLTVADLSTTSPTSLTSWKARMLDDLFLATDELFRGAASQRGDGLLAARRREALRLAPDERRRFLERFMSRMPGRYQLAHPPAAVVDHAELAHAHLSSPRPVTVGLLRSHLGDADELCVVADDRAGLLADITAAIAGARLEVLSAEIHSCDLSLAEGGARRRLAVDIFWVRHAVEGSAGVERAVPRIERDLEALLAGTTTARELVDRQSRRGRASGQPKVATKVLVDNRASSKHSVVEVVTGDRPALLFELASALHRRGVSISLAKIATEGTRVVDVFYVSEADGRKLDAARAGALQAAILDHITGSDVGYSSTGSVPVDHR